MTHNILRDRTEIISQEKSSLTSVDQLHRSSGVQVHRKNPKRTRVRSKKTHVDKIIRRGIRKRDSKRMKVRAAKLPGIPQQVLRVLKILRHEKFLDLVEEYFKPFAGSEQPSDEAPIRQSAEESSAVPGDDDKKEKELCAEERETT